MRLMKPWSSRQRFPEQEYPGPATPSPDYRARTQDYNPLNPPGFISSSQTLSQTQGINNSQHWRRPTFMAANSSQPVQAGFAHSTSKVPLIKRALSLQVPLVPTNTPTGVNQVLQRIDPSSFNKPEAPLGTFDAGPSATEATSEDQNLPLHPGTKRRLGVGRNNTGYANKKFKSPT